MSGILEALDMMYEVKGESGTEAAYRRCADKAASRHQYKDQVKDMRKHLRDMDYSNSMHLAAKETGGKYRSNMRNAQDYRDRVATVDKVNKRIKQNECTETIDTLEGIL